jgi:hemerythrin-like domain-containing protein
MQQDATELLKADHDRLRQALEKLSAHELLTGEQKDEYLRAIERELKIHSLIEEEIFYPAFKETARSERDEDKYWEALEEHHVVDMLLPEMKPLESDNPRFHAKAQVLCELVLHHAEEEEQEMFTAARASLGAQRLRELGERLQRRREELEAQWDTTLGGAMRKAQSIADKFLPSSVKDVRGELNKDRDRDERR